MVGILSTASDFNPCHATAGQLAEAAARGVRLEGALPFVFPTVSLHESFSFPTSMLLRNLMAMDVEEMVRALPLDAVVLIGGCDKTIPAELAGAISADMPAIVLPAGAMLAGRHEGAQPVPCTDARPPAAPSRAGLAYDLAELDAVGRETPVLLNLKPAGNFFMEDFHAGGGLPALWRRLRDHLDLSAPTVSGETIGDIVARWPAWTDHEVVRPLDRPVCPSEAIALLSGNLAPDGAAIKLAAATPSLCAHRGPALVFESLKDLADRIDKPDLPVTPEHVMVLRNAGPIGAPGMPEAGALPIPKKLGAKGITDMVRISDARMSGTAFGTVVLHIAPEASAGGPLALVRDGDIIALDAGKRRLDLEVDEAELTQRRATCKPPAQPARGYARLYAERVTQADKGCDFDFLAG